VNVPTKALPAPSVTPVDAVWFRPRLPLPPPVLAVTVHVVVGAVPETDVIVGEPVRPVFASVKFDAVTPLTGSLNVTVHETLEAFVGDEPTRLIDVTVGGVASTTTLMELLIAEEVHVRKCAVTR
jgi:hypothetical protein